MLFAVVFVVRQHDVRGFDVAVQHPAPVRVVEGAGDCGDDLHDEFLGHAGWVPFGQQLGRVRAVDEVHCDPQQSVGLAAVVNPDDVRVREGGRQVGLPQETLAVVGISRPFGGEHLQRVATGQPGVPG